MSRIKHFIEQSWLLITASFIFGLLLAVTDAALKPRILENQAIKLNNKMKALISDANSFEISIEDAQIAGGKTNIYRALDSNFQTAGFAFIASGAGFADKVKLVIAVDSNCEKFFGFEVLSSNETPGFGSKISEEFFGDQFKLAPADKLELSKIGDAEKIDSKIVAITGATVSSEAVVKIFNSYIDEIKKLLSEKELINGR